MTRRAYWWIVAAFVLLAVGFTVVSLIVVSEVHRLDDTNRTLKATQRQIATAAVHNAGAICLGLTAPSKAEEMRIVDAFLGNKEGTVVALFTPRCRQVALKAAHDIFDDQGLPPALEHQLQPKEKTR